MRYNHHEENTSEKHLRIGIKPDDTLLVHSSLKSLGWVDGGAETVTRALLESLSQGTELTARHRLDRTPVGEDSPFRLLVKFRGKILMLGCGLSPNTFMHGVEEAANLPYVLEDSPTRILIEDKDGNTKETFHYLHDFRGVRQRYDRVAECFDVKCGKILDADVFVLDALGLWNAASKKLSEDPWFFVDRVSREEVIP